MTISYTEVMQSACEDCSGCINPVTPGHPRGAPAWMPRGTECSFLLHPGHCDLEHFPTLFLFLIYAKLYFIALLCFLLYTILSYVRTFSPKYAMHWEHISLHSPPLSFFSLSLLPLVFCVSMGTFGSTLISYCTYLYEM